MQDDQVVEMRGFDAAGVLIGRAAIDWATGNWAIFIGKTLYCNVWGRGEAEKILRENGASVIHEGSGRK